MSPEVKVQGFPWCKDAPKTIGIASLVAKILCTDHNHALSPADEVGAKTFNEFRELQRMQNVRERLKPRRWNLIRRQVDGPLLERWLLKSLINVSAVGSSNLQWEFGGSKAASPSKELVEIACGVKPFPAPMGLYTVFLPGNETYSEDSVGIAPIIRNGMHLVGGMFEFRGAQFLLSLDEKDWNGRRVDFTDRRNWAGARTVFHPAAITLSVGGYSSQQIEFEWAAPSE